MDLEAILWELGIQRAFILPMISEQGAPCCCPRAPGLGILDVNIGGHLVFPLATEMRARQIPIVFSTGRPASELPPEWARHPILRKPLDPAR